MLPSSNIARVASPRSSFSRGSSSEALIGPMKRRPWLQWVKRCNQSVA